MKLGMITDLPIEDYHAATAVSSSRLKDFHFRPLYYWRKHVARILPPDDTKALRDGRAVDAWMLDGPEVFARGYVVLPEDAPKKPTKAQLEAAKPSPATVSAIEWWAAFEAKAAGKTVLTSDDWKQILMLEAAARKSPEVWAALQGGQKQVTFRKSYGGAMPPIQARPDVWCPDGIPGICPTACIVDMKTAASLTDGEFGSFSASFDKAGYYRQAGFHVAVVTEVLLELGMTVPEEGIRVFYAVLEKDPDVGGAAQLYEADQEDVVRGFGEVKADLLALELCYKSGKWPGALGGVQRIALKPWRRRQIDAALEGEEV
jgi:hypothetical protein